MIIIPFCILLFTGMALLRGHPLNVTVADIQHNLVDKDEVYFMTLAMNRRPLVGEKSYHYGKELSRCLDDKGLCRKPVLPGRWNDLQLIDWRYHCLGLCGALYAGEQLIETKDGLRLGSLCYTTTKAERTVSLETMAHSVTNQPMVCACDAVLPHSHHSKTRKYAPWSFFFPRESRPSTPLKTFSDVWSSTRPASSNLAMDCAILAWSEAV